MNNEYLKVKSLFDVKLTKHFPKKLDKDYITFTESFTPDLGCLELILTNKLSEIDKIQYYKDNAIVSYNAGDTCLLVVNRFASNENYYKVQLSKNDSQFVNLPCYSDKYPIPNFWHSDYTTNATTCKLPQDFVIYVIDSKQGKYVEDRYLTDGRYMPQNWKNGFSKGVAISEKRATIIYWLVIW
jgi:hypothetical protein